jgi:nucleotide-binding universal stress UspA family protein
MSRAGNRLEGMSRTTFESAGSDETTPLPSSDGPIVVGIDGGDGCRPALEWAQQESLRRRVGLQVVYVHETDEEAGLRAGPAPGSRMVDELLSPEAVAELDVWVRYGVGPAVDVLGSLAAESDASLLVVGTSTYGGSGSPLGRVTHGLVHSYPGPMAVVPADTGASAEGRIVVGVDGTDLAIGALRWAVAEAAVRGVVVDAVMAWAVAPGASSPAMDRRHLEPILRDVLNDAVRHAGGAIVPVRLHLCEGPAHEELIKRARGAQLLVVGAHQRAGEGEGVLGSVSEACAVYAPVPVVIIPGPPRTPQVLAS